MSLGPSAYLVGKWFDAAFNATSFSVTTPYLQLHTADPGAAGTTSVVTGASGSDRKSVSFGTPAAGVILNDVAVQWVNLTNPQDASHYSLWDALTVGNFLGSGIVNANAFAAGDTLTFAIGAISIAITVAA
jgi:hypothetical protein